ARRLGSRSARSDLRRAGWRARGARRRGGWTGSEPNGRGVALALRRSRLGHVQRSQMDLDGQLMLARELVPAAVFPRADVAGGGLHRGSCGGGGGGGRVSRG